MPKKIKLEITTLDKIQKLDTIPTGIRVLDTMVGGWPRGRLVELYGEEGTGKSTILYTAGANATDNNLKVLFVDAEGSIDTNYLKSLGLKNESLFHILSPAPGKEILSFLAEKAKKYDIIMIDSIAALIPPDEALGAHARMLTLAMRKLIFECNKSRTAIIASNQVRYAFKSMIARQITTGGNALKHYSSLRISLVALDTDQEKVKSKLRITKSKLLQAKMMLTGEILIRHGKGIDPQYDEVAAKLITGEVTKKGSKYIYNGQTFKSYKKLYNALVETKS